MAGQPERRFAGHAGLLQARSHEQRCSYPSTEAGSAATCSSHAVLQLHIQSKRCQEMHVALLPPEYRRGALSPDADPRAWLDGLLNDMQQLPLQVQPDEMPDWSEFAKYEADKNMGQYPKRLGCR